jgi:hypothetical protein
LNWADIDLGELLKGEVSALDINDLVSFANTVTGLSISQPPNFLDFKDVKLYICPAGTTIGTMYYPQGFSFQSNMILFGKRAEIACSVGSTGVIIKGGVDNFSLGPLAVRGVDSPRAKIDVDVSPTSQRIDIDGIVTFFDAQAAVVIKVEILPKPIFNFFTVIFSCFNTNAFSDAHLLVPTVHRDAQVPTRRDTRWGSFLQITRQCRLRSIRGT